MEVFTQFASDLDDATKAQLAHGKALMELLKQPLCHPLSLHEQVMTLIMANHGVFDTIETKRCQEISGRYPLIHGSFLSGNRTENRREQSH